MGRRFAAYRDAMIGCIAGRRAWLAVLAALASGGAAAGTLGSDCDQRFDVDTPASRGGDPAITELGCSHDAASANYCIALPGAPPDGFEAAPAAPGQSYRLWLRLATDARSTTLRIRMNDAPEIAWFAPPTSGPGWQLVTESDGRSGHPFAVAAGTNKLQISPRGDARAGVECAVLARNVDFTPDIRALHHLDRVWSGVGVLFDAVGDADRIYVGYYASDRTLSVAAFDRHSRRWEHRSLPSVFAGWDNHNAIALALDRDGNLHVAGNMHASPLVYARTTEPGRLASLSPVNRMIGTDEARATYPVWLHDDKGNLIFMYRDGVSGAGRILLNKYVDRAWQRLTPNALFTDHDAHGSVSAYPTDIMLGADGFRHIAWVWRRTADAETSFQVAHARSRDLLGWEDSSGRALPLPIKPNDGDIVDNAPEGSGLTTMLALGFGAAGEPIVSYVKYDRQGKTQLYNARHAAGGWQVAQTSDWNDRWEIAGQGTLEALIHYGPVRAERDGTLRQSVRHWRAGTADLLLDPATLRQRGAAPTARLLPQALLRPAQPYGNFSAIAIPVRMAKPDAHPFIVRWEAQTSNRDERPACTAAKPVACNPPPSDLVVYEP